MRTHVKDSWWLILQIVKLNFWHYIGPSDNKNGYISQQTFVALRGVVSPALRSRLLRFEITFPPFGS